MRKPAGELRRGWTTGACAAAATKAAYLALLDRPVPGSGVDPAAAGERPIFNLGESSVGCGQATAAVLKDAGDDPDVTHGALIRATRLPRRARQRRHVHRRRGRGRGHPAGAAAAGRRAGDQSRRRAS